MLSWLFLIATHVASAGATEPLTIVSDIDDTLRIADVSRPLDRLYRFIFTNQAFSGMPEVLHLWKERGATRIVYLSGAPAILSPRVKLFLKRAGLPEGSLQLEAQDRLAALEQLVADTPGRFILVGDDSQGDPEIYYQLFRQHPDRVAEIYIRSFRSLELPPAVYTFLTSYDVARYEYEFGRFSLEDVTRVATRILTDDRDPRVLPKFQRCPGPRTRRNLGDEIAELDRKIESRVHEICERRR